MKSAFPTIEKSLARIDEEISRLREAKTRLERERVQPMLKMSLACKIVKSPFRNIPVEVHQLILSHCVPNMPSPKNDVAPMLLCRISSTWRRLALSMPELWTEISFPFDDDDFSFSTRKLKDLLNLFAARSRDLPMSVHFILRLDEEESSNSEDSSESDDVDGVDADASRMNQFNKMITYITSWSKNRKIRRLHIGSPCVRHTLELLDRLAGSFENLEYLTIHGCGNVDFCNVYVRHDFPLPEVEEHLVNLLQAPKLRAISFSDRIDLALPHMTGNLFLSCVLSCITSIEEWIELLAHQFIVLQKGYFYFEKSSILSPIPMPTTQCPMLEELALDYWGIEEDTSHYHCIEPVLTFRFPSLWRLRIVLRDITPFTEPKPTCHIEQESLDIVPSCLPSLRELTVVFTWDLPTRDILGFLPCFLNLNTLTLVVSNSDYHDFMYFLSFRGHLPYLARLNLEFRERFRRFLPFSNNRADAFVRMVRSRWDVLSLDDANLRWVDFIIFRSATVNIDEIIEDMKYRLKEYTDNGLVLKIRNSREEDFCGSPLNAGLIHWENYFQIEM